LAVEVNEGLTVNRGISMNVIRPNSITTLAVPKTAA
jgi:hypothetical protein